MYPVACLGRITTYHRLDDGTYNLLLLGVHRVRLLRELTPTKLYREAEVELCEDYCPAGARPARPLAARLRDAFLRVLPMLPEAQEQMDQLLGDRRAAGRADRRGQLHAGHRHAAKEALLAEVNVHRRAELLLEHLAAAAGPAMADVRGEGFSAAVQRELRKPPHAMRRAFFEP